MPYDEIDDLPKSVKDNLPKHAQEIWKEAYDSAYDQYSDQNDQEETAARVAWSAVKKKYEKQDDKWVEK